MNIKPPTHLPSFVTAVILAVLGAGRFISDMLTDAFPGWYLKLEGTVLKYLVRAPSDGTFWGDINAQYFKLLAVPCGIAGLYLAHRLLSADLREADRKWHSVGYQAFYVIGLWLTFTIMEVEKSTHLMGLRMAGQLVGENLWLNQVLHLLSALLGWLYMRRLKIIPP